MSHTSIAPEVQISHAVPSGHITRKRNVRPFGMRDKIGYMIGDIGNDLTFVLQALYFTIFYTDVVGVRPGHVGLMLLIARLVDAFTDLGMGLIIDRTPVYKGGTKFKRWIRWMAIPVAIASALMYASFTADFDSYTMKVVWMCATYFLWGSVFYTALNIPYGSMVSAISPDPMHRSQLSVYRSAGATIGQIILFALLPLFVYTTNDAGRSILAGPRMGIAAIACSVLAVLCYVLVYKLVEERVRAEEIDPRDQRRGVRQMLTAAFSSKALLWIIFANLVILLGTLFISSIISYLFLNYFGNGKLQTVAAAVGFVPALVLIWIAPRAARRFGKAETGAVGTFVVGVVFLIAYFLKIENPFIWMIFFGIAMFSFSVFNYLIWAFITDVIDQQEVRTGIRDDGTVYSVYTWSRKLGQALAGGAVGWALGAIGYDSEAATKGLEQAPEVQEGIYMLANVVPAICGFIVCVALIFYPLKKAAVESNARTLAERHGDLELEEN